MLGLTSRAMKAGPELCSSSAGRSSHRDTGSGDMLYATGVGAKLSGLLGSALIYVGLQVSIDPIDGNLSAHPLNFTVLNTLQNGMLLVLYPSCSA